MAYPYPWQPKEGDYEGILISPGEKTLRRHLAEYKSEYIRQVWEKDPSDAHMRDIIPDDAWDFRSIPAKWKK